MRWDDARTAYLVAAAASPRNFAGIPRINAALAAFELGDYGVAEREAAKLKRRDPQLKDCDAVIATSRFARGDLSGAAEAFNELCVETQWCDVYSREDAIKGRWPPSAVKAYRRLLQEPSIARAVRNARAM